jgi:lipoprotein-releasing system permease protein
VQVTTATGDRTMLARGGHLPKRHRRLRQGAVLRQHQDRAEAVGPAGSYYTDINVKLKDILQAPAMAKELAARFEVDALDIQTANAQFETGSDVRNIISYAVGVVLLIVAGFGIYNILNMMIYEKLDAIAILKATGFSGSDVRRIFLLLSMIIGIVGAFGGLSSDFGLQNVIDNIPFVTQHCPRSPPSRWTTTRSTTSSRSPSRCSPRGSQGWFPARKASQVDPVEIIRGK